MKMKKHVGYGIAVCSLLLAGAAQAADNRVWVNHGGDQDWSNPDNWHNDTVPGAGDQALYSIAGIAPAIVSDSVPVFENIAWEAGGQIEVAAGGNLNLAGFGYFGYSTNHTASLLMSGGTATFAGRLLAGVAGTGTITVDSGTINANDRFLIAPYPGSSGAVVMNGGVINAATNFYTGRFGEGKLTVNSGTINANQGVKFGVATNSSGFVVMDGDGVMTVSSDLTVGESGFGSLSLRGNSILNANGEWTMVGRYAVEGSIGTMQVVGGSFNSTGHLYVGPEGAGNMDVLSGNVSIGRDLVGGFFEAGATANMTIRGGVVSADELRFDGLGSSALCLDGGQLISRSGILLAEDADTSICIGGGELVFLNSTHAAVEAQATNWNYGGGTMSLVDNGGGEIVVSGSRATGVLGNILWENLGGDQDWANPENWNSGYVPFGAESAFSILDGVAPAIISSAVPSVGRIILEGGGQLEIAAGGNLNVTSAHNGQCVIAYGAGTTGSLLMSGGTATIGGTFYTGLMGNGTLTVNSGTLNANGVTVIASAASSTSSAVMNGGVMNVANTFTVGDYGTGSLTLNAGSKLNVKGIWTMVGRRPGITGTMLVDGGDFNSSSLATSHLYIGAEGAGILTVNSGSVNLGGWLMGSKFDAGATADLVINGGVVSARSMDLSGLGAVTLDLNGGQLITRSGVLLEDADSTFYIGAGELVFMGSLYEDVLAQVSGSNWIFDEYPSVFERNGDIVVTSGSLKPATIVDWSLVSSDVMKLVVDTPAGAENYNVQSNVNLLVTAGWGNVPHSTNGLAPFVEANLAYSSAEGSNMVIYVQTDAASSEFFRIIGE